jgi:hypothetical protein
VRSQVLRAKIVGIDPDPYELKRRSHPPASFEAIHQT